MARAKFERTKPHANVGTIGCGEVTVAGSATHGVRINQGADSKGLEVYGHDDQSAAFFKAYLTSNGTSYLIASNSYIFQVGSDALGLMDDHATVNGFAIYRDRWLSLGYFDEIFYWVKPIGSTALQLWNSTGTNTQLWEMEANGDAWHLGKLRIGSTAAPTVALDVTGEAIVNEKIKLTSIGGYAIKLTNTTGANTVAGQVVRADTATNDAVILTGADEFESFGVFLDSDVADDAEAWVVVFGVADIAMEDNTTATRGNWVRTSITEAGYADATIATPPGAGIPEIDQHLHEIGHCIETVNATGEGTHILARCVIHFN